MGLILTIRSKNPELSYILEKNPATIKAEGKPFRRDLRKGFVYGWFLEEEDKSWRMMFLDSSIQSSFAKKDSEEFEYLDKTRYSNPYLVVMMIDKVLSTASKVRHEKDVPMDVGSTCIEFTTSGRLTIVERIVRAFKDSTDVKIGYEEIVPGYFAWNIQSTTVHMALNVAQSLCFLLALRDSNVDIELKKDGVEKYIRILNRCNASYYPRYMLVSNALHNACMFYDLKDQLDTDRIKLSYGDTRLQRMTAIKKYLTGGKRLLDIVCGEMYPALKLEEAYESVVVVDADEDLSEKNAAKIKNRNLTKFTSIHANVDSDWVYVQNQLFIGSDILMTEVLEHIKREDAVRLLNTIVNCNDYNRILVTLPNKDFNVNFGLSEEEVRHDDHKWEPSYREVEDWISSLAIPQEVKAEVFPIGDVVDNVPITIGIFFQRTGANNSSPQSKVQVVESIDSEI